MQEMGGAGGQSGSAQCSYTGFATCTNNPEERHTELLRNVGIFNPFLRREIIYTLDNEEAEIMFPRALSGTNWRSDTIRSLNQTVQITNIPCPSKKKKNGTWH
jgi:hypothetical protein